MNLSGICHKSTQYQFSNTPLHPSTPFINPPIEKSEQWNGGSQVLNKEKDHSCYSLTSGLYIKLFAP